MSSWRWAAKAGLVSAIVGMGCRGPESFHGQGLRGTGGSVGTIAVTVPDGGAAGTEAPSGGGAGDTGSAIPGGAGSVGSVGSVGSTGEAGATAGAASGESGAAGTVASAGTSGTTAAAGTSGGTSVTTTDAGAGTAAADAAPEAPPLQPYATTGWKPSASITAAGPDVVPAKAIDGNLKTRWTTGRTQRGDESFVVDLGKVMPVSQVVLDDSGDPADFPVAYKLELSTDGTAFKTAKTGAGAAVTTIAFDETSARYLRISQTSTTPGPAGSWWSIDEVRVYP
jgi:hypothetical protein